MFLTAAGMTSSICVNSTGGVRSLPPPSERLAHHPLADLFPMMSIEDLATLGVDIQSHGQRSPIVLLDNLILDGRNRYRACLYFGLKPNTCEYQGNDPLEFVLSSNLHRRHLSESQRAMVAAKIANLPRGKHARHDVPFGRSCDDQPPAISVGQAAASLNVGPRNVHRARSVLASPELARAVESGEMTVAAAERAIKAAEAAAGLADFEGSTGPAGSLSLPEEGPRDSTHCPIPRPLVPLWNRAGDVLAIHKIIVRAGKLVKAASADDTDPLWIGASLECVENFLHCAQREIEGAIPFALCVTCEGREPLACLTCRGKGFLSRAAFDICLDAVILAKPQATAATSCAHQPEPAVNS